MECRSLEACEIDYCIRSVLSQRLCGFVPVSYGLGFVCVSAKNFLIVIKSRNAIPPRFKTVSKCDLVSTPKCIVLDCRGCRRKMKANLQQIGRSQTSLSATTKAKKGNISNTDCAQYHGTNVLTCLRIPRHIFQRMVSVVPHEHGNN